MTRDDVIRMACDAGVWIPMGSEREKCVDTLQRFAGLVAAAEREACAKVCEEIEDEYRDRESLRYAELRTDAQTGASVPETWLEQGLKELDAIRQNSNRDDWQPNDENIVRRLYQAMVAYGVQQAPSVPYGWKLVPIEPTEEMMMRDSSCQKHAHDDQSCVHRTNRRWIWKTMLAAAPEAKRDAP